MEYSEIIARALAEDLGNGDVTTRAVMQNQPSPVSFEFNVVPVPTSMTPIVPGTLFNGEITLPGEVDEFTFTLAERSFVTFDRITNNLNLRYNLDGPGGNVFQDSTGGGIFTFTFDLPAGDYIFTVDLTNDNTGSYSYLIVPFGLAAPITPGNPIVDTLDPGSSIKLYQFDASAGDLFFFDAQSTSGGGVFWDFATRSIT